MEWKTVEKKLPWGVIILLGGGFALAEGSEQSGLSDWIGQQLAGLTGLSDFVLLLVLCLLAGVLTQIASNVTTNTILIPIIMQLAVSLKINPLYLLYPPTFVCSYAFMLPVSTAPNAIAFGPSGMKIIDMVKLGFFANIFCTAVILLCIHTYGYAMFDLGTFPEWANNTVTPEGGFKLE